MTTKRCGCERENDPWRRFCGGCGAALGLACSTCGFSNQATDRFCGGCGGVCSRGGLQRKPPPVQQPAHAQTVPIDIGQIMDVGNSD
jgi:hypothetical protein